MAYIRAMGAWLRYGLQQALSLKSLLAVGKDHQQKHFLVMSAIFAGLVSAFDVDFIDFVVSVSSSNQAVELYRKISIQMQIIQYNPSSP